MTPKFNIILNTIYQFGGRIASGLVSVIIVKLISNYLGVSGYGEYASTYEFMSFFAIFADMGIFTIAIREMAHYENDKKMLSKIFGNILSIRLVMTVVMMTIAVVALFLIPQYSVTRIPSAGIFASLVTLMTLMTGTLSSILQLFLKMGKATTAFLIGKVLTLGYIAYAILYAYPNNIDTGFIHLFVAGIIGGIVTTGITFYYARKFVPIKLRFDFAYWKEIIVKTAPYGAAIILNQIYFRIDSILLLLLKGPAEVGIYAVPMRVLEVLTVVSFFFMNATLPTLTRAFKKSAEEASRVIQFAFNFLSMAGAPLIVGGFILAYPIIFIISSPEFLSRVDEGFYGSDIAFQILTVALVGSYISTLFTYILVATERQKTVLWINGAGAIFNVIANLLIIPSFGARGAAYTSVASELLIVLIAAIVCYSQLKVRISLIPLFKIILSVSVMGLVIYFLRDPSYNFMDMQNKNILFLIPLGGIIYGTMLFLTGMLTKETFKNLKQHG
ncbi:MAG: flippase [Candidatus Peregrinibacteria bacterium]|nr:flippase [Candidatus Peregrinibacteria bacterium]MDZ4244629.1 flippase [Candidatus Gracilibacteria bacterium]